MDGQTDRRTDGQAGESDFTGCCPTKNAGDTNKMQLTRLRITYQKNLIGSETKLCR